MIGISLDHRGDTPERAEAFLTRQGHDSKQWDYLLSKESLHPLMRDGFMLGVREGKMAWRRRCRSRGVGG